MFYRHIAKYLAEIYVDKLYDMEQVVRQAGGKTVTVTWSVIIEQYECSLMIAKGNQLDYRK